jgi:hypothetical protein
MFGSGKVWYHIRQKAFIKLRYGSRFLPLEDRELYPSAVQNTLALIDVESGGGDPWLRNGDRVGL